MIIFIHNGTGWYNEGKMYTKIHPVAKEIFRYGSYARPLVNWALKEEIDSEWKY